MPLEFAWALVVSAFGLHVKSLFFDDHATHSHVYWSLKRWLSSAAAFAGLIIGFFYVGASGWHWLLLPVGLVFNPVSRLEIKNTLFWRILDLLTLMAWGMFVFEVAGV